MRVTSTHPPSSVAVAVGCLNPVWQQGFRKCRVCDECRRYEEWSWVQRVKLECKLHSLERVVFGTWTFRPRGPGWNPTPEICKEEAIKGIRRLRDKIEGYFGYLGAIEFGDENGRVHFHFLAMGLPTAKVARSVWSQGYTHARWVKVNELGDDDEVAYVAAYQKNQGGGRRMVSKNFGTVEKKTLRETGLSEIWRWFPQARILSIGDTRAPYAVKAKLHAVLKEQAKERPLRAVERSDAARRVVAALSSQGDMDP